MPTLKEQIEVNLKELQERDITQKQIELAHKQKREQYIDGLVKLLREVGVEGEIFTNRDAASCWLADLKFTVSGVYLVIQQQNEATFNLKADSPLRVRRTLIANPPVDLLGESIAEVVAEELYKLNQA